MALGDSSKLIAFLRANRQGERFLLATPNAPSAAPIIIETGEPVMAMGGFIGSDPILTPERLEAMVAAREVRYFMVPSSHRAFGPGGPGGPPPTAGSGEVAPKRESIGDEDRPSPEAVPGPPVVLRAVSAARRG